MAVNEAVEKSLKRNTDNSNEDLPDLKIKRLDEAGVSPSDSGQPSSQESQSTCSSQTTNSSSSLDIEDLCIDVVKWGNLKNLRFSFGSPKKNFEEPLFLTPWIVFKQMMDAFSKTNSLQEISFYGRSKYELVDAYAEFWETLFLSPEYTTGSDIKVVNSTLDEKTLLAIAKILRRGWEDVRFFPKKLAQPFLEACIYNRQSTNLLDLKPELFEQYIEKKDREIIKFNEGNNWLNGLVNEENIKVFGKYEPPPNTISIGEKVESACKKVIEKVMFTNVGNVRKIWTEVLIGLLEFDKFKFLGEEEEEKEVPRGKYIDVGTIAPHLLWSTFFYKWTDEMKEFYLNLLTTQKFKRCTICNSCQVDGKHMVSIDDKVNDTNVHFRMLKERHDNVLNKIVEKIEDALKCTPDFELGKENWKLLVMPYNYRKPWPRELMMLEHLHLYPHIVLYCTSPHKRALIMDLTVCWDKWATKGSIQYVKSEHYFDMVIELKNNGFDAQYYDVKVGARGLWSEDLYHMFDKICGMESSEITKTMEEISKIVIEIAYNFQCKYNQKKTK